MVGSSWVGIAAKLGRTHVIMWLSAMLLFYVPLAVVVIYLNRMMPLEGGLYQWAKAAFGEAAGFLIAVEPVGLCCDRHGEPLFSSCRRILATCWGLRGAWLASSKPATLAITGSVMLGIAAVAIRGLDLGKWLHNIGSAMIMLAYAILLGLPLWALSRGTLRHFDAIPLQMPKPDMLTLAIFGQMTVGALSGFEYVAILAGECRSAARTVGQSVMISAPVIALMFILGTSSVLAFNGGAAINVIGPIPQTMRIAFGAASWVAPFAIALVIARAIASSSLIFTGLTRLPMAAGWDGVVPRWFTELHPVRRTPINSILFVAALVMILVLLSMLGVREQEASQLLAISAVVHYAIAYVALFAIPVFGKLAMPSWIKPISWTGLIASVVSLFFSIYPIVDVVSKVAYAGKILAVVIVANLAGILAYRLGRPAR